MNSPAQQIKERLSIVDVVSSYIKLEKAGANFKARCPFHNEKTPSFVVSPARGSYHCFGCNKGGDIFSFVEEIEGDDFRTVLEKLADRAGIQLKSVDPKERSEQNALYAAVEAATKFFEFHLGKNAAVQEYLRKRGLKDQTIKTWRIGYAPNDWRQLLFFLKEKGFAEEVLAKAGLIIKSEKGYYDRFRNRVMFPIADNQGRIVGFSGRIFDVAGAPPEGTAKYVNSPETPLYNKSRILFGYDKAKHAIMQNDSCVMVEGQMDLIMAHQAGTTNAVAVSGTALTEEHIGLIKRFTDNLLLSFDADDAGFKASERGVKMALASGMDVKIVKISGNKDPADAILADEKEWHKALAEATHIIPFYLNALESKDLGEREFKKEVSVKVLPYVAEIKNKIDQAHFIREISSRINAPEEAIREEISNYLKEKEKEEKKIFTAAVKKDMTADLLSSGKMKDAIENKFFGIILWQENLSPRSLEIDTAKKEYQRIAGCDVDLKLKEIPEKQREDMALYSEVHYGGHENMASEIEELLASLEKEILQERYEKSNNDLKKAEKEGNGDLISEILKECQDIQKRIHEIKNSRFLEK